MRKQLLSIACLAVFQSFAADKTPVWRDPNVNQVNREQRHAHFFAFESEDVAKQGDKTKSARYLSMEGMWKFCFVKNHQDDTKDFFGLQYDASKCVDYPVTGHFQLQS